MSGKLFLLGIVLFAGKLSAIEEPFTSQSHLERAFYDLYKDGNISWDLSDGRKWTKESESYVAICLLFYLSSSTRISDFNSSYTCASTPLPRRPSTKAPINFQSDKDLIGLPPIETDLVKCECETRSSTTALLDLDDFYLARKKNSDDYFQIIFDISGGQHKINRFVRDTSDEVKRLRSIVYNLRIQDIEYDEN